MGRLFLLQSSWLISIAFLLLKMHFVFTEVIFCFWHFFDTLKHLDKKQKQKKCVNEANLFHSCATGYQSRIIGMCCRWNQESADGYRTSWQNGIHYLKGSYTVKLTLVVLKMYSIMLKESDLVLWLCRHICTACVVSVLSWTINDQACFQRVALCVRMNNNKDLVDLKLNFIFTDYFRCRTWSHKTGQL